jgi:translation initiation factor 6 (eIF-6)
MSDRDQLKAIALLREAMEALANPLLTNEERAAVAEQIDEFLNYGRPTNGGRA